jgi:nitroreductase
MEQFDILPTLRERWSPRVYKDIEINDEQILSLIEAARWAPSSRNSQPWRFIYATKNNSETWNKLIDSLTDFNKVWVKSASHLMLACVVKVDLAGRDRKHAWYDLGLAIGNLTFQANSMGIYVRNMGGFEPTKAIQNFSIPDTIEPVVMLALGYPDETVKEHELFEVTTKENRRREETSKLIFENSWDNLIW